MDDRDAIQLIKEGDIGGLEYLIVRYQDKGLRAAYMITRDLSTAEDAVQDTYIQIFKSIRHYDAERPFEPYFLRSVINTALNGKKKTSHWFPLANDLETEKVSELIQDAASVENQVEYIQLKEKIEAALTQLSPQQRAVVVQRYYLNMSEKEMSDVLEVAPGTIKWLLNMARKRLRSLIGSGRNEL